MKTYLGNILRKAQNAIPEKRYGNPQKKLNTELPCDPTDSTSGYMSKRSKAGTEQMSAYPCTNNQTTITKLWKQLTWGYING